MKGQTGGPICKFYMHTCMIIIELTASEVQNLPKNRIYTLCKYLQALSRGHILYNRSTFFSHHIWAQGTATLFCSLSRKSRKSLARNVDSCATHASLVCDIIGTNCHYVKWKLLQPYFHNFWWLFPHLRGFWENVQPYLSFIFLFSFFFFFVLFKWKLAYGH